MDYEEARRLLFKLQDCQVRTTKRNGQVTPNMSKQINGSVRALLKGLVGVEPTDDQVTSATYR